MATIPEAIMKYLSADTSANHHVALLIGLISIATIVFLAMVAPKGLKLLPAALVGVVHDFHRKSAIREEHAATE